MSRIMYFEFEYNKKKERIVESPLDSIVRDALLIEDRPTEPNQELPFQVYHRDTIVSRRNLFLQATRLRTTLVVEGTDAVLDEFYRGAELLDAQINKAREVQEATYSCEQYSTLIDEDEGMKRVNERVAEISAKLQSDKQLGKLVFKPTSITNAADTVYLGITINGNVKQVLRAVEFMRAGSTNGISYIRKEEWTYA